MAYSAHEFRLSLLDGVGLDDVDDCQGTFRLAVFGFDWNVADRQRQIAVFAHDCFGVWCEGIVFTAVRFATTRGVGHGVGMIVSFDIFVDDRCELAPDNFLFASTEQLNKCRIAGCNNARCIAHDHAVCGMFHEATVDVFRLCA